MQKMPQNGQKRRKVQKPKKCTNENWPIFIPCDVDDHFWWSKQAKNTQKQPYLVGLSENRWKNTKNAISQKGLAKRFWKLVKFMSYMCTSRIKSKQTSYRKVRLDVIWGKCVRMFQVHNDFAENDFSSVAKFPTGMILSGPASLWALDCVIGKVGGILRKGLHCCATSGSATS